MTVLLIIYAVFDIHSHAHTEYGVYAVDAANAVDYAPAVHVVVLEATLLPATIWLLA